PRRPFFFATIAATALLLIVGLWFAAHAGKLSRLGKEYSLALIFMGASLWLLHSITRAPGAVRSSLLSLLCVVLLATDLRVHNLGREFNTYSAEWVRRFEENFADSNPFLQLLRHGIASDDAGPYRAEITAAESIWANGPKLV